MPRHFIAFFALITLVVIPVLYAGLTIFGKDIVCLADGSFIEADESWQIGEEVYYFDGGGLEKLPGSSVNRLISGKYGIMNVPALLNYYFAEKEDVRIGLLAWMAAPAGPAVLLLLLTGIRRKGGREHRINPPAASGPAGKSDDEAPQNARLEFEFGIEIVRLFLQAFRYTTGAPKSAPAHITSVDRDRSGNYIYRLHVRHRGRWYSRRMTIGPIGEDTRSKSRCFYVIYDDHMVIKIPPEPLVDFNQYIDSIRGEIRIAEKIAPRECLVPRLSTILRRIYRFPGEAALSADQLEDRYLTLLESREELKEFLKIGNTHAYFMDLARYFFLGPIMDGMHDAADAISSEILRNPDILFDSHEFASRYGNDADAVRRQILPVFTDFQRRGDEMLCRNHLDASAFQYRRRAWFAAGLAAGSAESPEFQNRLGEHIEDDLPRAARKEMIALLTDLFSGSSRIARAYRTMIGQHTKNVSLLRNEPKMSSLITSLLDLLFWLESKGIAIRDLKPDNLLVAGDPAQFPVFLNSAGKFNIGLIDLETAVDFGDAKTIAQPLLGGTVQYATPSNFFPNEVLSGHFENLSRIFYLQDWFAAIAIIYELIAGELLFVESGRLLGDRINAIDRLASGRDSVSAFFRSTSAAFWQAAADEFSAGCAKYSDLLKGIRPVIPVRFKNRLIQELKSTMDVLKKSITRDIEAQSIFRVDPRYRHLLDLTTSRLEKRLTRWRDDAAYPDLNPKVRREAITFLENLMEYHAAEEQGGRYLQMISDAGGITAEEVIRMMFFVIRNGMRVQMK